MPSNLKNLENFEDKCKKVKETTGAFLKFYIHFFRPLSTVLA